MKDKIQNMYVKAINEDLPPNLFADQVLRLFGVSGSLRLHSDKIELLDRYTKFLQKHGYIDTDATCKEPFAIDEFLRNDR